MSPDAINEIIWHFAGYFRIADDVARDRLEYLEGAHRQQFDDYTIPLPENPFRAELEPFDTRPYLPPSITPWEGSSVSPYHVLRSSRPDDPLDVEDGPRGAPPRMVVSGGGGGGAGGGVHQRQITVNYDDGGDQQQVQIRQVNRILDDDLLLTNPNTGVTELNDTDTHGILREMSQAAANAVPADVALPQGGMAEIADFVRTQDNERAESGGGDNANAVDPGIYVDGEQQSANYAVDLPDVSPPGASDPPANVRGEIAELSSNTAVNAALIVDKNEGNPTMIVVGDFFATEAIIQTYSYTDNDEVSVGGSDRNDTVTGDNAATNIAQFEHDPSIFPDLTGYFSGWVWNVDVVSGDFYDINLLVQEIYLSDNDVTVQDTHRSLYEVHTGDNQQFNLAQLLGGEINNYDLIIIGGDYHGGNYIFQHIFLVDNDVVLMANSDGEPTQTIGTGGNTLVNYGTIQTFGNETFVPLTDDAESLVTALQNRQTSLDPLTHGFVASGLGPGPIDVLYITGDYYDINAIWQYITVADADTALQLLSVDEACAGDKDADAVQSIKTGGNTLLNDAEIIDVGAGTTQVGGDVYSDTILVQAKLVSENDDSVVHNDTDALVNELIAFIGPDEHEDPQCVSSTAPSHTEDPISGVLA
jgi:hypothetical protein